MTFMVLNGTAIAGQKDHAAHAGSSLLGAARTAARYRCFAVRDEFPGLYPQPNGGRMVHAMLLVPSRLAPGDLI
ncbi:MAG TPA: hypothetical protein VKY26_04645, partial [Actinomycetota bacterium]|nr:hypothetical protein [Actinomycetota bacterium]